ncbi:MAG: TROVE domain-containing protein [Deltaproteobacteria bacterium]|nr:TROVE domain-containing protein [Deltaproteobacteria bacterium]
MSIKSILSHVTAPLPQSKPLPGQVANAAGGHAYAISDRGRLERFLILGADGGSYYASERALTLDNAAVLTKLLAVDGVGVVDLIVEVSVAGRAPKNDPAIFALAVALKKGDLDTRRAAALAVPKVCRTSTHLFALVEAVKGLGGFGRITDRALERWYVDKSPAELALQLAKYQQRNGWSHKDVLRKAKPVPSSDLQKNLFAWAVGKPFSFASSDGTEGKSGDGVSPFDNVDVVKGFELVKQTSSSAEVASLITRYRLPREVVPTEHLGSTAVWASLLTQGHGMPLHALVRNLGKMTAIGLLAPLSSQTLRVVERLTDRGELKAARVHPLQLLVAARVYAQGRGDKGSLTWTPVPAIVGALEEAFHLAFAAVEPTGKRWLLGLDVSGSMGGGRVANSPLTPREAAAALALVTLGVEDQSHVVAFSASSVKGASAAWSAHKAVTRYTSGNGIAPLPFTKRTTLREAIAATSSLPFGATDCALPMRYALALKIPVDVFVVLTDSETWAGDVHPTVALADYRKAMGIAAKLVVVGMVSNGFTIADPNDAGMLDVVGFDSAVPALMATFAQT